MIKEYLGQSFIKKSMNPIYIIFSYNYILTI